MFCTQNLALMPERLAKFLLAGPGSFQSHFKKSLPDSPLVPARNQIFLSHWQHVNQWRRVQVRSRPLELSPTPASLGAVFLHSAVVIRSGHSLTAHPIFSPLYSLLVSQRWVKSVLRHVFPARRV